MGAYVIHTLNLCVSCLTDEEKIDQVRNIYNYIESAAEYDLEILDETLDSLDVSKFPVYLLLGITTATADVHEKLPSRLKFLRSVDSEIKLRTKNKKRLVDFLDKLEEN